MLSPKLIRFGALYGAALAIGYFGPGVIDRFRPPLPHATIGPGELPAFVAETNLAHPGAIRRGTTLVKVPSDACNVPAGSRSCYAYLILSAGTPLPNDTLASYVVP